MKQNKMREEMKDAFINALKEEQIPWQCDWSRTGRPENAVTGRPYRGVNSVWLSYAQGEKGYRDPRWCTFKQAQEKGWKVKKGEKGTRVEFWSLYDTETKQKISNRQAADLKEQLGDDFYGQVKPISSVYTVFNAEQIEGIPERAAEKAQPVLPEEMLAEKRDVFLKNMGLSFQEGGDKAFYSPGKDQITMPEMGRFRSGYGYMSTFLHEAGHATGHESRLDRAVKNSFGTPDYAREELRAEIASAFTAQELGLPGTDAAFTNHKAYIQDWIMVLEKDPGELFAAIRDAEKISDYLLEKGEFDIDKGKADRRVTTHTVTEQEMLGRALPGEYGRQTEKPGSDQKGMKRETEKAAERQVVGMDKFSETQQDQIQLGLEKGLDVSVYADPKYDYEQMSEIRRGLENGVDVSKYADPKFSGGQMLAIREGLEDGVDVSIYTDTRYKYDQMTEIRRGLKEGLDVSGYANPAFDYMQMEEIRQGLERGLDVSVYADPAFDNRQMQQIWQGLEEGLDISLYIDPRFGPRQMEEIRQGLKNGVDVKLYADIEFERKQMEQIRLGLEHGVNVSLYADPEFSGEKMEQIREGLEKEQTTTAERKVIEMDKFNEAQQNQIQLGLEKGLDVSVYADSKFNADQMSWIRDGLETGVDVGIYADPKFTAGQMSEIYFGLENGVDVSWYSDPKFNERQMGEIREGLEKKLDIRMYADPKFNGDQMSQIRQGLENGLDVNIYADQNYNPTQMSMIRLGLQDGLDVNVYVDPKFNWEQMDQIRKRLQKEQEQGKETERKVIEMDKFNEAQQNQIQLGLEKGLDVSVYADSKFNADQMEQIRKGLKDGLDVNVYADPKFNADQMSAIRNGLELEVDVSKYADPKYDFEQMMQIHFGLEFGVDVSVYADPQYNEDQMREIRSGLQKELDVSAYADPKFSHEQMSEIQWGLQEGLDARIYADPRFDLEQIKEIQKGLEQGLDVSKYADPKFSHEQMMQIHFGLEDGADVSRYADPKFNADQMSEIRWGLKDGLDVNVYADPKFNWEKMKQIREGLKKGEIQEKDQNPAAHPDQMTPEQLYQTMTPEMQQMYDMAGDYFDKEGMGKLLEEQKQELVRKNGRQTMEAVQEQAESKADYPLVRDVAEMEVKLNIPLEKRLTEQLAGDPAVFTPKKGVRETDLTQRREEFQRHHTPLFGTQDAAKLRLAARGREMEGFHPDPVHLQAAQMVRRYQEAGLDGKEIAAGKVEKIREAAGIKDPQYAKNLVCSILSGGSQGYEELMGLEPVPAGKIPAGREGVPGQEAGQPGQAGGQPWGPRQPQAGQVKPQVRARQAVRGGMGR